MDQRLHPIIPPPLGQLRVCRGTHQKLVRPCLAVELLFARSPYAGRQVIGSGIWATAYSTISDGPWWLTMARVARVLQANCC